MNLTLMSFVLSAIAIVLACKDPSGARLVRRTNLCLSRKPFNAVNFSSKEGEDSCALVDAILFVFCRMGPVVNSRGWRMGKREVVGRMRVRVRVKDRGSAVRMVAMISDCKPLVVETGLRVVD
jgi:hypothetical protein